MPVEGCWAFAAPDVDGDGRDEIAVATGPEYDAVWFSLYRVEECGSAADCVADRWLQRFGIVEPGDPDEGFPAGPVRFRWGGPPEDVAGVTCGRLDGEPALVSWYTATDDQWLLVHGPELALANGAEVDLTTLGLDEICGARVWRSDLRASRRHSRAPPEPCQPGDGAGASLSEGRAGDPIDELRIREFLGGSYPRLVTAVAVMCGSRAAAEDAVQEALARAWERALQGYEIRELEAWVRTVAVNLSRSTMRRRLAERRAGERLRAAGRLGGLAPEPSADRLDVLDALAHLPRLQREATVLRYYLDLDVAQIAETLSVHQGTVKTTLHRARRALATALGEAIPEEARRER